MAGSTSFADRVYAAVQQIPYGKVATYGQIATICGNPHCARAVGNALHINPRPDEVPCYRVVNSQGRLAEHFGLGGLAVQQQRLESEGVVVTDGAVDLRVYQWRGIIEE